MKKTLTITESIKAPPRRVWEALQDTDTYKKWTEPFCPGTYFEGSWEEGEKIAFLAPNGDGMVAEIAANRPGEFVSIRHLGQIKGGVEDTTSEGVREWAPAYENYRFVATQDGTDVTVEVETMKGFEKYMLETFPKALRVLKEICERQP